uniref:Uncharacterized protein n=1 Tax=Arundo donax TaxID=35708 RepID=A0A0A9FTH9_ARUDO
MGWIEKITNFLAPRAYSLWRWPESLVMTDLVNSDKRGLPSVPLFLGLK